jgi:hypothetical protein
MGLRKWFAREAVCPACGHGGARASLGRVECLNPACANYSSAYQEECQRRALDAAGSGSARPEPAGDFDPGPRPLEIHYLNHRGQTRTFTGQRASLRPAHEHITVCLAPTGRSVSLARTRILNLPEVEAALAEDPVWKLSGRERRVVLYHRRRGSSSPLYEKIRQKHGLP